MWKYPRMIGAVSDIADRNSLLSEQSISAGNAEGENVMDREKELSKLVNVLRRTARMATHSEWTGSGDDAAGFCVDKYNRVLARCAQLDPGVSTVFDPLPAGSSMSVVAMACRQLASYFEDEVGSEPRWGDWKGIWADPRFGVWVDKGAFKDFWTKSAKDIEDFGEFIRERVNEWVHQHKAADEPKKKEKEDKV